MTEVVLDGMIAPLPPPEAPPLPYPLEEFVAVELTLVTTIVVVLDIDPVIDPPYPPPPPPCCIVVEDWE